MAFFFDWQTFFHASYVAFVFATLFFGALAFRQVVDNLEVRRLQLGEDRGSFLNAPLAVGFLLAWLVLLLLLPALYLNVAPSIYLYALPLILTVQLLQLSLRLIFQRVQVKTRGMVLRSMLWRPVRGIPFSDIIMIRLAQHKIWTEVSLGLKNEEVVFRIFSFSRASLERMLASSCSAPILWTSNDVHDQRSSEGT